MIRTVRAAYEPWQPLAQNTCMNTSPAIPMGVMITTSTNYAARYNEKVDQRTTIASSHPPLLIKPPENGLIIRTIVYDMSFLIMTAPRWSRCSALAKIVDLHRRMASLAALARAYRSRRLLVGLQEEPRWFCLGNLRLFVTGHNWIVNHVIRLQDGARPALLSPHRGGQRGPTALPVSCA